MSLSDLYPGLLFYFMWGLAAFRQEALRFLAASLASTQLPSTPPCYLDQGQPIEIFQSTDFAPIIQTLQFTCLKAPPSIGHKEHTGATSKALHGSQNHQLSPSSEPSSSLSPGSGSLP